jgi:hypothetical protein
MLQKGRKNKNIAERELEIIRDFYKSLSIQKKPSGAEYFFSWLKKYEDVDEKIQRARRRLYAEYHREKEYIFKRPKLARLSAMVVNASFDLKIDERIKYAKASPNKAINAIGNIIKEKKKYLRERKSNEQARLISAISETVKSLERKGVVSIPIDKNDPRLKTLSDIAKQSEYKREYLGCLARQNKLRAQKIRGVWMTTNEWVNEFTQDAKERKIEMRSSLSEKMNISGMAKEKMVKPKIIRFNFIKYKNEIIGPALAIIMLAFIVAAANFTLADYFSIKKEVSLKMMGGYNLTISKIAETVKPIARAKIGGKKITRSRRSIAKSRLAQRSMNKSKVATVGKFEDKVKTMKSEAGIVAGESIDERGAMLNKKKSEENCCKMKNEFVSEGDSEKIVDAREVTKNTKIFINFETDPGARHWVEKISDPRLGKYKGFKLSLSQAAKEKINFSWRMINVE